MRLGSAIKPSKKRRLPSNAKTDVPVMSHPDNPERFPSLIKRCIHSVISTRGDLAGASSVCSICQNQIVPSKVKRTVIHKILEVTVNSIDSPDEQQTIEVETEAEVPDEKAEKNSDYVEDFSSIGDGDLS
jgi:hypothetical protein